MKHLQQINQTQSKSEIDLSEENSQQLDSIIGYETEKTEQSVQSEIKTARQIKLLPPINDLSPSKNQRRSNYRYLVQNDKSVRNSSNLLTVPQSFEDAMTARRSKYNNGTNSNRPEIVSLNKPISSYGLITDDLRKVIQTNLKSKGGHSPSISETFSKDSYSPEREHSSIYSSERLSPDSRRTHTSR